MVARTGLGWLIEGFGWKSFNASLAFPSLTLLLDTPEHVVHSIAAFAPPR